MRRDQFVFFAHLKRMDQNERKAVNSQEWEGDEGKLLRDLEATRGRWVRFFAAPHDIEPNQVGGNRRSGIGAHGCDTGSAINNTGGEMHAASNSNKTNVEHMSNEEWAQPVINGLSNSAKNT